MRQHRVFCRLRLAQVLAAVLLLFVSGRVAVAAPEMLRTVSLAGQAFASHTHHTDDDCPTGFALAANHHHDHGDTHCSLCFFKGFSAALPSSKPQVSNLAVFVVHRAMPDLVWHRVCLGASLARGPPWLFF